MTTDTTKTIRIKASTLLRLYGAKVAVGMDDGNNMPTLDTVINAALDSYEHQNQPATMNAASFGGALRAAMNGNASSA